MLSFLCARVEGWPNKVVPTFLGSVAFKKTEPRVALSRSSYQSQTWAGPLKTSLHRPPSLPYVHQFRN